MCTEARTALAGAIAAALLAFSLAGALSSTALAQAEWTTYHRDRERSGVDPEAAELGPIAPVTAWQTPSLGAPIWGQPLVLGERVYVATVGDQIYAFNAVTGAVEWQSSAGTPVPSSELPCGDIAPTVGIVGTPVIDIKSKVIYAVADTWEAATREAHHFLEGFALANGERMLSTPVDPPGVNPETLLQRSGLNLDEGDVVFGFGENEGSCSGDLAPIVAAPELGGAAGFWQDHDNSGPTTAGGLWATSGASINGAGDIFATTANPLPPPGQTASVFDFSDSVLKLRLSDFSANPLAEPLSPEGWFEPPNWEFLGNHDLDLGSAGAEPLPGGLLFQAGKDGKGYLVDEATMGSNHEAVFAEETCANHGSFGGDAFWQDTIYIPCTTGVQALSYEPGTPPKFTPRWQGPADAFGPPIVSGGLVWVLASGGFHGGGTTLYGLEPSTGKAHYTVALPSPITDHFGSPSAAGGRLFVATGCSVTAYEIAQHPEGGFTPEGSPTNAQCPPTQPSGGVPPAGSPNPPGSLPSPLAQGAPSILVQSAAPAPAQAPAPLLLETSLHATPSGRVRLRLRCTAASGSCAGSVTLNARFVVSSGQGARRRHRTVLIALARAHFHHAAGDFTVTISLDRAARAHLQAHGGRLALRVAVSPDGSGVRVVSAVLTA